MAGEVVTLRLFYFHSSKIYVLSSKVLKRYKIYQSILYLYIIIKTAKDMKTEKAFAELRNGSRIGIVTVIRSYWHLGHIVEIMWADGFQQEYFIENFKEFRYLMS